MSEAVLEHGADAPGKQALIEDWSRDKQVFGVPWGKAMMWIFLLSDTFIFSCFLVGYMMVRISTTDPWPNPSEVFALEAFGYPVPLLLIAIMTFVLITSSGTMALAVNMGYRKDRKKTFWLMVATAALGALPIWWSRFVCAMVFTKSAAVTTRSSRLPAFTGTLSTLSGYSSSHFSTSGKKQDSSLWLLKGHNIR